MDNLNDKKWFVYVGDHHEGPYSLEDIRGQIQGGTVTHESYVWAEGMADWEPMTAIESFKAILSNGGSGAAATPAPGPAPAPAPGPESQISIVPDGMMAAAAAASEPAAAPEPAVAGADAIPDLGEFTNSLDLVTTQGKGGTRVATRAGTSAGIQISPAAEEPGEATPTGGIDIGATRVAPMPQAAAPIATSDEVTGEMSPKDRKRAEKEAKKAAARAAKEAKKAAKAAAKEAKIRAKLEAKELKEAEKLAKKQGGLAKGKLPLRPTGLGIPQGGPQVRGGERRFGRFFKLLVFVGIVYGAYYAHREGYLQPVYDMPAVKSALEAARPAIDAVKPVVDAVKPAVNSVVEVAGPIAEQVVPALKAVWGTATDFARPYVMMAAEKVPFLAPFVSPIPRLDGVSDEDYDSLKEAAAAKLDEGGPRAAVAMDRSDPANPAFYVATNLPDGSAFEVYLIGISETLLNSLGFQTRVLATASGKVAHTQPVRRAANQPLPKGEYMVYVMESDKQPPETQALLLKQPAVTARLPEMLPAGRKITAVKPYFLGGEKDPQYAQRLKQFHDKVKSKAIAELGDLQQFVSTIDSQLASTTSKFSGIRRQKPSAALKGQWLQFHASWIRMDEMLAKSTVKWTPEELQNNYFYGKIFGLARTAAEAIQNVHKIQQSFFMTKVDPKTFDIQLGEAQSRAQSALAAAKAKVAQARSLPPTPRGLPRRDGL